MSIPSDACDDACAAALDAPPNDRCACAVVDVQLMRDHVLRGLPTDPAAYADLFSPYAVFVETAQLRAMADTAAAIIDVASRPGYAAEVLSWAPAIARIDPGGIGGVLGLDFHLTVDGPRLIEINTNPGGLLLNAHLVEHVASCVPARWRPPVTGVVAGGRAVDAWLADFAHQLGRSPARIAIVDEAPRAQFLYPEFVLYQAAFRARGVECVIRAPNELQRGPAGLVDADGSIEAIYNRLTDFSLQSAQLAPIAGAYVDRQLALAPHPRAHALFADKRNLAVLGDANQLESLGVAPGVAAPLAEVVPDTRLVTEANRTALWTDRAGYFFKPAAGYGSRGSYRGGKISRRTWDSLVSTPYVAQALVSPSLRVGHGGVEYKVDVRCFASEAGPILFAARLYQGQTTNMRTTGGGFAAVLSAPDASAVLPIPEAR